MIERFDPTACNGLPLTDAALSEAQAAAIRPPRHRAGEKFLRGPIPWVWLERASRLQGRSLVVALILWKEAGCMQRRTVRFRLAEAKGLGMSEDTARRGLRGLADAGLVRVLHRPGRCSDVELLEVP